MCKEIECPKPDCIIYSEGNQRDCTWVHHDTYEDCVHYQNWIKEKVDGNKH